MHRLPKLIALFASAASAACAMPAELPKDKPLSPVAAPSKKPQPVGEAARPEVRPGPTGEVPAALIEKMRADLSERLRIDASAARVVSSESVIWPDGSLGCAVPNEIYTQATVPGYRVQFELAERTYTYHSSARGFFKLCPDSPRPPSPEGTRPK